MCLDAMNADVEKGMKENGCNFGWHCGTVTVPASLGVAQSEVAVPIWRSFCS